MTSAVTPTPVPARSRLQSWKEVARYFGRTDRTVKRWELERGLPIHRPPGAARGRIYAEVAELESWLKSGGQAESRPAPLVPLKLGGPDAGNGSTAPSLGSDAARLDVFPWMRRWTRWRQSGLRRQGFVALTIALPLTLAALVAVIAARSASRPAEPPLAAERLYVAGIDDWQQRTPASLNRAIGEFRAAIRLFPRYAQAYAGLADCYDLLREYTLMPATQSFTLARAAATRAVALDDRLAGAHAALAFADYFGFWDAAAARAHFQRAVALDPNDANTRHWYATFLLSTQDTAGARAQIDAAFALDPASPSIQADRDLIRAGIDPAGSYADLRRLARDNPGFLSPHIYLADRALQSGDDATFLNEAQIVAQLTSDAPRLAVLAAARAGSNAGGHRAMLAAMLAAQTKLFEAGTGDALELARTAALLGDRKAALGFLNLAVDRQETDISQKAVGPPFGLLYDDPGYRRLMARLKAG